VDWRRSRAIIKVGVEVGVTVKVKARARVEVRVEVRTIVCRSSRMRSVYALLIVYGYCSLSTYSLILIKCVHLWSGVLIHKAQIKLELFLYYIAVLVPRSVSICALSTLQRYKVHRHDGNEKVDDHDGRGMLVMNEQVQRNDSSSRPYRRSSILY
jgi:hypothetical protein